MIETLANPYGPRGRAARDLMTLPYPGLWVNECPPSPQPSPSPRVKAREIVIGCLAAALLLVIPALGLRPASADVVELKGGDRVEGALREATPAGVVVEVGGQSIRFEASSVRAIYFGSPVPPAPPDAPPASAAPPAPSVPPSPGAGGLQIVQSLRATVATGTTLRDYETRLHGVAPLV